MRLVKKSDFDEYIKNKIKKEDAEDIESSIPSINPVSIEDVKITGTGIKGSSIIVSIGTNTYTGKVDNEGKFDIPVTGISDGDVVIGTQNFGDKITSEEERVTVGIGKGQKPIVNEIRLNVKNGGIKIP